MTIADDAIVMAYDFDDHEALMIFLADTTPDFKAITDYWDDATDCMVRTIKIAVGEVATELSRNEKGQWLTPLGLLNGAH
jgi:hypothetical protein